MLYYIETRIQNIIIQEMKSSFKQYGFICTRVIVWKITLLWNIINTQVKLSFINYEKKNINIQLISLHASLAVNDFMNQKQVSTECDFLRKSLEAYKTNEIFLSTAFKFYMVK